MPPDLEEAQDPAALRVPADDADGNRVRPQGLEVLDSVARSAQGIFLPLVGQDEDRGLAGDAAGRPVEMLVEDEVAPDADAQTLEPVQIYEKPCPILFVRVHGLLSQGL